MKNQNEGCRPAAHAAKRGPGLELGRAAFHLGLRPLPVQGRGAPVPGLRLCGPAVSAPAHGAATLALSGGEAGRLPIFRSAEAAMPWRAWTWDSNPLQQDSKSCALPNELVLEKLKGIEPPTSRMSGRSTTELQPRLLLTRNTLTAERQRASRVSASPDTRRRCPVKCSIPAELKRSSLVPSYPHPMCARLPCHGPARRRVASRTQMG